MSIRAGLEALVAEARATGTLAGLPDRHFIDGRWTAGAAHASMPTFDPGTGAAFASFAAGDARDVEGAVAAARAALDGPWRRTTPAERGRILQRTAALIREHADRLSVVEALDSGKRLVEAQGDVASAARAFEYYAGACDKLHGDTIPLGENYFAYTIHEPVGVAAQIVPWNYPLATTARGLAPALAAGCAVVVKPAEQTPLTALLLAELIAQAGAPAGVCNVVTGTGTAAGAPLVAHPGVDHITFTGSVATGIGVMKSAADHVARVVLELGGKSPIVVLADADLAQVVEGTLGAIFENAGQICSAGSRLVVARSIHAELVERLAARADAMTIGHGLGNPDLGPVNSPAQLARIEGYVDRARGRGVRVAAGGARRAGAGGAGGWFYAPTILDDVALVDEIVQDEIFGPVLCVQVFDDADLDRAVALANGTAYALVAGIYTHDFARAHRLARDIDAGQVYVNEYFAGGIEVPFGGNRRSGFGREKGLEAVRSYCKVKSVAARL